MLVDKSMWQIDCEHQVRLAAALYNGDHHLRKFAATSVYDLRDINFQHMNGGYEAHVTLTSCNIL